MTARVLLALALAGLAAIEAVAADVAVGRYPPTPTAAGSVVVIPGQPLTRGSARQTRPRGDSFVPGLTTADDSTARLLPTFRAENSAAVMDRLEVVFLARTHPVRLTVFVTTNGQSVAAKWNAHLVKLFAAFDRDHDGMLNRHELEHIIPVAGIRQILQGSYYTRANGPPPEMPQIDRDGDGRVSFAEFAAYYQEVLPTLVAPKATPGGNGEQDLVTTRLFARIDQNGDGKLSREELKSIEKLLPALDADEDECITAQEVLAGNGTPGPAVMAAALDIYGPPPTKPTGTGPIGDVQVFTTIVPGSMVNRVIKRFDKNNDYELTRDEIGFDAATFDRLDANHDGKLSASELDIWRTGPPDATVRMTMAELAVDCKVAVEPTSGSNWPTKADIRQTERGRLILRAGTQTIEFAAAPPPPQSTREQQIRVQTNNLFPNGRLAVTESDIAGPQFQFLRVVFDAANFDGDGTLTRAEFDRYFDLQASTAELGLILGYVVRTPNLFEMLDDNQDRKLSVRELRSAWDRMIVLEPNGAADVTKAILQPSVIFRLSMGTTVGAEAMAPGMAMGQRMTQPEGRGPRWFRRMDRNSDGDVSRAEFLGPAEDFAMLDTNGDGLISLDEAEAYDAKARPKKK